jgi:hypothetical protein
LARGLSVSAWVSKAPPIITRRKTLQEDAYNRMMIEYLNHRFGERCALYERYFRLIDTALELQNEEITRLALESILNIYQDNPGGGLEEFRQQFEAISEVVRI